MKFTVVTLFPELIAAFSETGVLGQAVLRKELEITTLNPRRFTADNHQTVDDKAFGGGDGMVMKAQPLIDAIQWIRHSESAPCHVVVLGPQGRPWRQGLAREFAQRHERLVLVCGRYAGIDHRFTVGLADEEISIGDFILSGGEVAAMAIVESVARLSPGVLGNSQSALNDSFGEGDGLLECPQFTRPQEVAGLPVPSILVGGDHKRVREFQQAVSLTRTVIFRPDLLPGRRPPRLIREMELLESLPDNELAALGLRREQLAALKGSERSP